MDSTEIERIVRQVLAQQQAAIPPSLQQGGQEFGAAAAPWEEQANVSAQTISHAELGKKAMRADTIIGVCGVLEISADYLLFGNTLDIRKIIHCAGKSKRLCFGSFGDYIVKRVFNDFISVVPLASIYGLVSYC